MKNYSLTLTLLLAFVATYCQQAPVITDTTQLAEPVLLDTTPLPPSPVAADTPSIQLQPTTVDTAITVPSTILKAEAPAEPKPVDLKLEKGRINVRAGGYYLAGSLPVMGIGAVLTALSYTIKVKEPQSMRAAGYAFIGIGGVFTITGLGHIIHGKKLIREAKRN